METGVGRLLTDEGLDVWPEGVISSAFAIGGGRVLTAWHCIDEIGGTEARLWLRLQPRRPGIDGIVDIPVRYKCHNPTLDAAMLVFDDEPRPGFEGVPFQRLRERLDAVALRLGVDVHALDEIRVIGFPERQTARFAVARAGIVESAEGIVGRARAISLHLYAAAAVSPEHPRGMSGGPLLAKYRDGVERVVGIVSKFPSDGAVAIGGSLICRHIADVKELLPVVAGDPRSGGEPSAGEYPVFLNREEEAEKLTTALRSDHAIIVVTGGRGVGKSKLVSKVLADDQNVQRHDLSWGTSVDVKTLIDDLTRGDAPARRIRHDETPTTRLRAAVEALHGEQVVIVIDPAENLLDDSYRIRDPNLDEAFELLSDLAGSPIKVVLVSQDPPRAGNSEHTWPSQTYQVDVKRLEPWIFEDLLHNLNPRGNGLSRLSSEDVPMVYEKLRGNPRLAVLLDQIVSLAIMRLGEVVRRLTLMAPKDVRQNFTDELIRNLPEHQKQVVFALAAFGTQVDAEPVIELLAEKPERVRAALEILAENHVIRTASEQRYYVPPAEIENTLGLLPDGREQEILLLRRAAAVLNRRQPLTATARGPADLELHFAELKILRRAGRYRDAHELIESMAKVLRPWNRSELLLDHRESVKGRIGDAFGELRNYNELGDIYVSRGLFDDADAAYRRALEYQQVSGAVESRRKIQVNIAALDWERNRTRLAADNYRSALTSAMLTDQDDSKTEVLAREGLADCHRRWGQYADAIQHAERAFSVARRTDFARATHVAVKLARWHAELGRLAEADHWMANAEQAADEHTDESLRAVCLDGRADLLLEFGRSRLDATLSTARLAINIAADHGDPVLLLQARTTCCFAYLLKPDLREARREIDRAAGLRRKGRSLLVLALQALAALEKEEGGTAKREFERLYDEAALRRSLDEQDFAAWDFEGIALCARGSDDSLRRALSAFVTARRVPSRPTPGLTGRVAYIVDRIGQLSHRPDRFRDVLDVLGSPIGSSDA